MYLYGNQITQMNWENAPSKLTCVYLGDNQITLMNWEHAPKLTCVSLGGNQIKTVNWKNVPTQLIDVSGFEQQFKEYKSASKIQRAYIRHYTRRQVAAYKITNGCHL